jgi:hypothetical protein
MICDFFYFLQSWGSNPGPHTCWVAAPHALVPGAPALTSDPILKAAACCPLQVRVGMAAIVTSVL